jgi:UDP-N-acetylmuramoyl-L-alanyl-D-glutamate--2,6-diaminopimelate ligase
MSEHLRLSEIIASLPDGGRLIGSDPVIAGVTHDSRAVRPGDLFVAIPGASADGHDYVDRAFALGAVAVVVERDLDGVSRVVVPDARAALPWIAAATFGNPSDRLPVVGVTGTNGKTTVTHLLEQIVLADGRSPGVIGTIGARIGSTETPVARTTPEASDLQRILAEMVDAGVDVAAIEVSSHALSLHRVDAVRFRVAGFTNLMQDHLDFHGDMERYFAVKASLFTSERTDHAVISIDDPAGLAIVAATDVPTTTVGLAGDADITASAIDETVAGTTFQFNSPAGSHAASLPLPGRFNVQNALVAGAIALELGIDVASVVAGFRALKTIPGRFERIVEPDGVPVVVDYAHTPDAIDAVVDAGRRISNGRLIVVFGAGGDRDQSKRAAMGRAASRADLVILTSDNPRSEDPRAIASAVRSGIRPTARVVEEPNRRLAIRTALAAARSGDLVLVLGKGHEQGQEIAGRVEPFDDRAVVREELRFLAGASS